jgi:Filamin/ABP280 repeat
VEDVLATVTSPTGVLGQCNVSSDGPGVYYVSFMPSETGEHIINVKYKDSPVPGS